MDEPRASPEYPDQLQPARWFCLECVCQTVTEAEMKSHVRAHHDNDSPLNQIDYVKTEYLIYMRALRRKWIEQAAEKFAREMHPEFGAEDFVAEAEIRSA